MTSGEVVAQLGSDDRIKAFQARRELRAAIDAVTDAHASEKREALADELAAELIATLDKTLQPKPTNVPDLVDPAVPAPKHSAEVRRQLCRLLAQICSDNQVPALTAAAQDLEIREEARWALGCLNTQVASSALIKALGQVGPEFRVGVISSLAQSHWADALAALRLAATDPDAEVRLAALEGAANFPEFSADQTLAAAARQAKPAEIPRIQKARVRLAETFRQAGQKQAAAAVYQAVLADTADGPWKKAARLGLEKLKASQA